MIYFDNAATTEPSQTALNRASEFATSKYYNPSALYGAGVAVSEELSRARLSLLSRIASEANFELIFTSCGSESDNQAIFGFGKRGNVVCSAGEHAAVYSAVQELKNRGVEVRFAPVDASGRVIEEELFSLVDNKTSLVTIVHVNNETGAINDIGKLSKAVKEKNPRTIFHSDGVQAFGKFKTYLNKEIDLYSLSAHKIGGLKGTGALIKRCSLALPPYIFGGGQEQGRRSGTENVLGILDFAFAAEEKFSRLDEDFSRLQKYRERLWEGLDQSIFARISPEDGSPYILTVSAKGLRGEVLQRLCFERGLIVGTGSACSSKHRFSRVITACGYGEDVLDGVLRMSFSPKTTEEEIEAAIPILNSEAGQLKEKMA